MIELCLHHVTKMSAEAKCRAGNAWVDVTVHEGNRQPFTLTVFMEGPNAPGMAESYAAAINACNAAPRLVPTEPAFERTLHAISEAIR